jgi:hypothetical protein
MLEGLSTTIEWIVKQTDARKSPTLAIKSQEYYFFESCVHPSLLLIHCLSVPQ